MLLLFTKGNYIYMSKLEIVGWIFMLERLNTSNEKSKWKVIQEGGDSKCQN